MANERLEPLAKAMRAAVTDEEKQRAWERLEVWERKEYLRMARAACEFFFGKNSGGYVIVPAEAAVGKAREALREGLAVGSPDEPQHYADACGVALRALGRDNDD